mmetsp:Transcript_24845/g.52002  ORF Transcript_24845/g.52002 Transcript_24845/m.52002 type:complete len:248 (-) Transcript_24845:264-1007(-)
MPHQSLSPYEQARLDRIKRNEERLASLGLSDAKKRVRNAARSNTRRRQTTSLSTPRKQTLRKKRAITPSPARSSRRLKRKPVQYKPLMDDDEAIRVARKKFKVVKRLTKKTTSNFICDVPTDVSSSPLTVAQKAFIGRKMEGDFLAKFEEYVTEVDTLSDQNRRNVLRQVTKLAMGEGIRYDSKAYGWPEDCYFIKGTKVGPTSDILKLMELGQKCEDEWGRDHGNGWLLRHPLKKLYQFQQYLLQY